MRERCVQMISWLLEQSVLVHLDSLFCSLLWYVCVRASERACANGEPRNGMRAPPPAAAAAAAAVEAATAATPKQKLEQQEAMCARTTLICSLVVFGRNFGTHCCGAACVCVRAGAHADSRDCARSLTRWLVHELEHIELRNDCARAHRCLRISRPASQSASQPATRLAFTQIHLSSSGCGRAHIERKI